MQTVKRSDVARDGDAWQSASYADHGLCVTYVPLWCACECVWGERLRNLFLPLNSAVNLKLL
jgi:hypothetical protein